MPPKIKFHILVNIILLNSLIWPNKYVTNRCGVQSRTLRKLGYCVCFCGIHVFHFVERHQINMVFVVSESSRVITLLSSESKIKRKESLTAIENDCEENITTATADELKSYCSFIIPRIVNLISDPVESHRERSLSILSKLCEHMDTSDCFIPYVTCVLVKRLTVKESLEESEEIRLRSLKLLYGILQKLPNCSSCIDDYCLILEHSLEDNFHEVKVMCCNILCVLAKRFSSLFYHAAEPILKPLLKNIVHQQHKVRFATVEAVGVVFEHCNGKFVDHTIAPLTQRLFDSSIAVRKAVIQVVGEWLLNLTDRYSYHAKLLPIMLSGQIDQCTEIRDEAIALWDDVGRLCYFFRFCNS